VWPRRPRRARAPHPVIRTPRARLDRGSMGGGARGAVQIHGEAHRPLALFAVAGFLLYLTCHIYIY
jgi:hypothetical protein